MRRSDPPPAPPVYDPLAARAADLPTPYTWADVLTQLADGDEDRFLDLWITSALPHAVRLRCLQTLPDRTLLLLLLRRLVRQQTALLEQQKQALLGLQAIVTALAPPPR